MALSGRNDQAKKEIKKYCFVVRVICHIQQKLHKADKKVLVLKIILFYFLLFLTAAIAVRLTSATLGPIKNKSLQ